MAISIRLNNPMVAEIDKEGFRRLVRFVLAGGQRKYSLKIRLQARAVSWGRTGGLSKAGKSASNARAAREQYAQDSEAGSAAMLGEPAFAGWQEGTYAARTVITSNDAPSAAYMARGWDVATRKAGVEREQIRAQIEGLLVQFDPLGQAANASAGGASGDQPLLKRTTSQRVSSEAVKTEIFDEKTRELLAKLTRADRMKVVDLLCPPA